MKLINLTQNKFALVDDEDYDLINLYKWYFLKDIGKYTGYANRTTYLSDGTRKEIHMHRFIMAAPEGFVVDHIDGNGINNQKSNLRICSQKDNKRNGRKYKNNISGYKGVYKQGNLWRAQIRVDKKLKHLGYFATPQEAAKAYDKAAILYFGEFANINIYKELL